MASGNWRLAALPRASMLPTTMSVPAVSCRSCLRELAGSEVRRVAEWSFCEPCFTALMKPPERKVSPPSPRAEQVRPGCALCKGPLTVREGQPPGLAHLCGTCAWVVQSLAAEDAPAPPPEHPAGSAAVAQEPVSWTRVACTGCGRSVQERASKLHAGRPYCPDCHHALPPAPSSPAPEEAPAGDAGCEACGRDTAVGAAPLVQGFRVCAACRVTDEALALELARARHRRRLEQLKGQLLA